MADFAENHAKTIVMNRATFREYNFKGKRSNAVSHDCNSAKSAQNANLKGQCHGTRKIIDPIHDK